MDCRYLEPKAIAEMLRGAIAEFALICAEPTASPEALAHVECWTARWIDLVESMLWKDPSEEEAGELRDALARLREVSVLIAARGPAGRPAAVRREFGPDPEAMTAWG